jgi:hypothetical protein
MKARVVFGDEALRTLYGEVAGKIELIDQSLRENLSGFAVEAVVPEAKRSFSDIGIELTEEQVHEYARSIAERRDFEFVLQ